jgi:hypothetical protein
MSYDTKQNIFTGIIKYLPLITLAVMSIFAWANLNNTINNNDKRITALEASDRVSRDAQNQMLIQLSQIQADLGWIKNQLK